jgi:hypothetical protein
MNQGARKAFVFTFLAAGTLLSCRNSTEPESTVDSPGGNPGVLTRSNNLERTGATLVETTLRPDNLTNFGKLYCQSVDSEIYGQILYVPNLDLGAKGKKNMVYVVTMQSTIYAFDANDGTAPAVWTKAYANPGAGVTAIPVADVGQICLIYSQGRYNDISQFVGILSTPVIDAASQTIYFVARVKEGANNYLQRLHALSLVDGSERLGSPVTIEASTGGTALDAVDGVLSFNPRTQNQRTGLLLHHGVVYITWASHCDQGPYHGWVIGYDASSLQRVVVYNTSPNGKFAGIWMSGQAPSADADGNIYLMTGNGTTDLSGGPNHGNSFLKLRRQGNTLAVVDWFTPFNVDVLEMQDRDLGAGGAVLVPGKNIVLGAGKEGKLYMVDTANLGKFNGGGNDEQIMQRLDLTPRRQHLHGSPVYWKSGNDEFVYVWPEEDYLKQLKLTSAGRLELQTSGTIRAPFMDPDAGSTMPGGVLSLSANGDKAGTGILWVNIPIAMNAIHKVVPGVLRAFDANDVTKELWNSEMNPERDAYGTYAKYNPVTVYDGKVFVPTFSKQYCVYGNAM